MKVESTETFNDMENAVYNFADYLSTKVYKGSVPRFVLERFMENFPTQFNGDDKRNYLGIIE